MILFEPEIAANTGSIGRTCVAAGADPLAGAATRVFISTTGTSAARALDYWEHLDLRVVEFPRRGRASPAPGRLWYFSTKAKRSYTDAEFAVGDALVFGPETRGLPERLLSDAADRALRIPIRPEARSLNLANAVAIGVFEAVRQIGHRRDEESARLNPGRESLSSDRHWSGRGRARGGRPRRDRRAGPQ